MRFELLTSVQIQKVYFELKSQKAMKQFFGDKYETLVLPLVKQGLVMKPTDFLTQMEPSIFLNQLADHDGSKGMARHYGVSVAFVRTLWRKHTNAQVRSLTKEELISGLEAYGSVRMLCRLEGLKESVVRKVAAESGLELAPYLNFEFGDYEVNRGRRGEVYWKTKRGLLIIKDMNEAASSQSDYDFQDASYGKVNVKASKRYKFKAKTRKASPYYWTFSTSSIEKCDNVVFVLYDPAFENAIGWGVVSSVNVQFLGKKTFTIRSEGLGTPEPITGQIFQFVVE